MVYNWEDVKVGVIALVGIIIQRFMNNPVGTFTALVVLLYTFERWRDMRATRKLSEKKLRDYKEKN